MVGLMLEYSPSNRAACKGARPCFGTKIAKGELRLGEPTENYFVGDGTVTYKWRHWGCVTPALLNQMKRAGGARNVAGFARLSVEDQNRVTTAVQRGSVDPEDVPHSARPFDYSALQALPTITSSNQTAAGSQLTNKRKRDDGPSTSQASARSTTAGPLTQEIIELSDSDSDSDSGVVAKKRKVDDSTILNAARALENRINTTFAASQAAPSTSNASAGSINAASAAALNDEVIDLGDSDNEEDAAEDEVYVHLPTDVVGIKYYRGLVGYGEQVNLVREPNNQYDRNAIRVMNISGHQVGHLPKNVVAKLAPLLDRGLISVEGTMTSGNIESRRSSNLWKLSIDVSILGPSNPAGRKGLEPLLTWATPGQRGFEAMRSQTGVAGTSSSPKKGKGPGGRPAKETAKAVKLREIMDNMAQLDDSSRRETLLNSLCGQDVLELPLHPSPPDRKSGLLHTNLLKHQKQALLWCINAENPRLPTTEAELPVQFWQIKSNGGRSYYYNLATKTPQEARPVLGRGGIIGDDMGLGKTLSILALILATREEKATAGYSGATLIIAPLSVLSNWSTQLEEHITGDAGIKAHVYYGDGKNVSASFLKRQDVVITTYQSATADLPSTKTIQNPDGTESIQVAAVQSGLFAVRWKRCVLDEGHTIRNPKTKTAQACYALDAERRWIVSGTPIINNPSDLGSLLRFLRICNPLNHPEYFKRLLSRPLSKRDPDAVELLKALMSSCCLRRTKEMQDKNGNSLVPLPPVVINVVKVKLDDKTREFYDAVEEESRGLVQDLVVRGPQNRETPMGVNVLSMLTRLRQIALDRHLVPPSYLEELRAASKAHADARAIHQHQPLVISEEEKSRLQDMLGQSIKDNEECCICIDTMTDPRITVCAHRYCLLCITEVINRQAMCPFDRRPLRLQDLIEPRPPQEDESEEDEDELEDQDEPPSAKIVQLIELLRVQPRDSKSLVFSQFTKFLDKIGVALRKAKIPFVRFDGSMSAKKRKLVLDAFSEPLTRDDDSDEDQTEPESDDDGYEGYWDKRNGKGNAKAKAVSRLLERGKAQNPVVMLISLKSGALGLNCTVANNVFLMDPWWQEAIESQAIDRVNRLGQKKDVFVYQMVAEDTIETKVLQIQERKKQLIQQAFSGTRTKQTQRQKKEARLHELIQLFDR